MMKKQNTKLETVNAELATFGSILATLPPTNARPTLRAKLSFQASEESGEHMAVTLFSLRPSELTPLAQSLGVATATAVIDPGFGQ